MKRVPALVAMHADLGPALLRAAASVYGVVEGVEVLSNEGLSREGLEREIARRIEGWNEGGLVLTDFWGGSCYVCGAAVARGHGDVIVLTGLNLPTLLDYLHNRDDTTPRALGERLLQKGKDSIRLHDGQLP